MNLKQNIVKKIINDILKEADVSVTGDKVAASGARGEVALEKSKRILSSLGIGSPELDTIWSVPQLEVEAFQFDFTVQDLKDDPRELTTPQEDYYSGLARVAKFDGNLVLEFKPEEKGSNIFTIEFSKDDVFTNLPGTKKNIPALVEKKQYNVKMGGGYVEYLIDQSKDQSEEKLEDESVGNFYNGKDIKEVNFSLNKLKQESEWFKIIKNYKDDPEFQKMFLDLIIDSTKGLKINNEPLFTTLKKLKENGLLESNPRENLQFSRNFKKFMNDLFKIFAKLSKNGKQSQTYNLIKDFYKKLYFIASKGENNIDEKFRKKLLKNLLKIFSKLLTQIVKLPEMTKGGKTPKKSVEQPPFEESFFNYATDLVLEEDIPTEEKNKSEGDDSNRTLIARILITSIEPGKKAEEKKKSDIKTTFGSSGVFTVKQMKKGKFYPVTGKIKADTDSVNWMTTEIENLFNTQQNYLIRKSEKDEQSIVIKIEGEPEFIMVKPGTNWVDWFQKKPIPITIGKKALGTYGAESFKGTIQLQPGK